VVNRLAGEARSSHILKMTKATQASSFFLSLALIVTGCRIANRTADIPTVAVPSPTPASLPGTTISITLPVLDALFGDESFKSELQTKLQLTAEQVEAMKRRANDEVSLLRDLNAEEQAGNAREARERASAAIREIIGDKTESLLALAQEHWIKGGEDIEAAKDEHELTMLPGPNAIPRDTRVIVNIPAFRMDVFRDGSLIKSYLIGIGYPQFPLPTGLRKAQNIILNPSWTPPDSPWVSNMKNVVPGERIEPGSPLNPLGPIKIPIGMPSLIHGGKPSSKIGTFASHGCVGLTNSQVKDFAKLLLTVSSKDPSARVMTLAYKDKTKTRVVKLDQPVPVELRYETIVVEEGKLHIYKDVYDQNSNTEENLRVVLQANGIALEELTSEERARVAEALNAMSAHPKKRPQPGQPEAANAVFSSAQEISKDESGSTVNRRVEKKQKEITIEIGTLRGKGYPTAVELDMGSRKSLQVRKGARQASGEKGVKCQSAAAPAQH